MAERVVLLSSSFSYCVLFFHSVTLKADLHAAKSRRKSCGGRQLCKNETQLPEGDTEEDAEHLGGSRCAPLRYRNAKVVNHLALHLKHPKKTPEEEHDGVNCSQPKQALQ